MAQDSDESMQELDQIMSEIEQLHEEMATESKSASSVQLKVVDPSGEQKQHEFQSQGEWAGLEETLFDQMAQEKEVDPLEGSKMEEKELDGCLTMTLTGNMNLKLKYEYGGQEVTVGFNDQFLIVQMADGTEFKVPVGKPMPKRKVA